MDACNNDKRIVMTLEVAESNFIFSAIQGSKKIIDEIVIVCNADSLDHSMQNIIEGFLKVQNLLPQKPVAISFAIPGSVDYKDGIIGNLRNFSAFRGGVAVGPMLKRKFNLPVFINSESDLYAYGEANSGILPEINCMLAKAGNPKRYRNLLGISLDSRFESGIVGNGELYLGDNSMAGEICLVRNKLSPQENVGEFASITGIQEAYAHKAGVPGDDAPTPKEIFEIATGKLSGNKAAAIEAYSQMARIAGDAISNAITLLDGLVVIGGELTCASSLFMPFLIDEMRSYFIKQDGTKFRRLASEVYNLELEEDKNKFITNYATDISVYGTDEKVKYDPTKKIGVGISKIGKSNSITIGAYSFALRKLDEYQ